MLGAAQTTATEGDVALTERRYAEAAALFAQAAGYVPARHRQERLDYMERQAEALYRQGAERGDNADPRDRVIEQLEKQLRDLRRQLEELRKNRPDTPEKR